MGQCLRLVNATEPSNIAKDKKRVQYLNNRVIPFGAKTQRSTGDGACLTLPVKLTA
jgi:hypothetical protein